jgi:MFS family permease
MCFGTNFIYDVPGVLGVSQSGNSTIQERFHQHGKRYTNQMNQLLYSFYSFPNTVLLVAAGFLIDHFLGLTRSTMLFACVALAGSVCFFLGVQHAEFWALCLGRVLLGCGCESLGIAQSAWIAQWFENKKGLTVAFGAAQTLQRSGSFANFALSPLIASHFGIDAAVGAGIAAVGLSVLAAVLLLAIVWFKSTPEGQNPSLLSPPATQTRKTFSLRHVKEFSLCYWLLCISVVALYTGVLPFVGVAKQFVEESYHEANSAAALRVSVYQATSALLSPVAGAFIDRFGRNARALLLSSSVLAIGLLVLLTATPATPSLVIFVPMGAAFAAFVSCGWASIPLTVAATGRATAIAIATAGIAFSSGAMRLVVGAMLDINSDAGSNHQSSDFHHILVILCSICGVGALAALLLTAASHSEPRAFCVLDVSPDQRAALLQASARLLNEDAETRQPDQA